MTNQKNYYEAKEKMRNKLIEVVGETHLTMEQILLLLNELQGEVIRNAIELKIG